ncbi:MAG TPA: MlaD family protein [Acetobacteraceae bacterium]|jgi:phospholipid/cholesterol/gamma-HCH transport system substrate-binding protein|nr:MlaD family protein [Acetobacteraceae bacterium]
MESRANYVAVGAFVLLVLAGIVGASLWLARVEFKTDYRFYKTHVADSVSGLEIGAPVRLNGIDVGRVTEMHLDPKDPKLVTLIMQIQGSIEIHADAMASLETQGFTGVSYVEISGGTLAAPLLTAKKGEQYPTIASRRSSLDLLFASAPEVLAHLLVIANRVEAVLDEKNRTAIADTLANLQHTTDVVDHRSKDIDRLISDAGETMHNLATASSVLDVLVANLEHTSGKADRLVASANTTFTRASKLANDLDAVVRSSSPGLQRLTTTDTARLDQLLISANRLTDNLTQLTQELQRNPQRVLFGARLDGYRPP